MAKAKSQIRRVSRRRPAGNTTTQHLTPASLTVGSPEIGAPQLGQIHRIRRRVHHLTAASLPGSAPEFVFVEDHAAPPPVVTRRTRRIRRIRPRDEAKTVIDDLFANGLPPNIKPNDLYETVSKELKRRNKKVSSIRTVLRAAGLSE